MSILSQIEKIKGGITQPGISGGSLLETIRRIENKTTTPIKTGTFLRQAPKQELFPLKDSLPGILRKIPVVRDVIEGLFGIEDVEQFEPKDVDIITWVKNRGLIRSIYQGATKTEFKKVEDRYTNLIRDTGADPMRATQIATQDVFKEVPKSITPTEGERGVLTKAGLFEKGEIGLEALDILGFMGIIRKGAKVFGGRALKEIAEATSEAVVKRIVLKELPKAPASLVDDIVRRATKVKNEARVSEIITEEISKLGKVPTITKELEPLAVEARKFRTAKEFVQKQRATTPTILHKLIELSPDKSMSERLTDFFNQAKRHQVPTARLLPKPPGQIPPVSPLSKVPSPARRVSVSEIGIKPSYKIPITRSDGKSNLLPAIIQGETFTLGASRKIQPPIKDLRAVLKAEIKATKEELKNARIATGKVAKLEASQRKTRVSAIENMRRFRGKTDNITEALKSRHLSNEDIANIILEDGTKLTDTARVKRNPDGSLAAVIKKSELENLKANYTDEVPKQKWQKRNILVEGVEVPIKAARSIELPYVWFERKGLGVIHDAVVMAGRDAETMKTLFVNQFKDAKLFKEGGWFTADRFNLSKSEAQDIAKYYLTRQGRGFKVVLEDLSPKSKKFVEIFDGIIKETEPRFFETAKLNGKTPRAVENYAPIMTKSDMKLADEAGSQDWLFRKHPSFSSLKERQKRVPASLYELDYREVASRWLDGITDFLNFGETTPKIKYLVNSDEFQGIVKESDHAFISNWLKDVTTAEKPSALGGQALASSSKVLRKGVAAGALGLNYASVLKQALTQVPMVVIAKTPPKLSSQYARAFGINVSQLPSITKRGGDIAIVDMQGRLGRIFTGPLTKFDRINAQLSLNGLLDKEYGKFLKEGADITPEVKSIIEKRAQDATDLWYGGFFKGQRPEAFRKELGNFLLMFLYPLTSQLNGFYRHILKAQGSKKVVAGAEVLAAAVTIAYMEQVIENLSPKWSDEAGMTQDVMLSLTGNIPLAGNIAYSIANDTEFQISPSIASLNNIRRNLSKGEGEKTAWAFAETFGVPKQIRRIKEGMEIMESGGITDSSGKMLAPVQDSMELIRSFLRGKYGSAASQDWVRNIGEKTEDRRWFVPEVEFLQNGNYDRKAELYRRFDPRTKRELRNFLSEAQQQKLDKALEGKSVKLPSRLPIRTQ